jgi:hypothetical protein
VAYPRSMGKEEVALIGGLLAADASGRLGVSGGEAGVRSHAYFKGVDWFSVENELLVPLVRPFIVRPGGSPYNESLFSPFDSKFYRRM